MSSMSTDPSARTNIMPFAGWTAFGTADREQPLGAARSRWRDRPRTSWHASGRRVVGAGMTGRRVPPKRLVASVVLFCIGTLFFVLAAFFSAKGARWANEFSSVAGFFVALAALLSPLAGKMFNWLQKGSVELATVSPSQAAEELAFALNVQWA